MSDNPEKCQPKTEEMAYAASCPSCGALRAAIADVHYLRANITKAMPGWVRMGLIVDRRTCQQVREMSWDCTCGKTGALPLEVSQ